MCINWGGIMSKYDKLINKCESTGIPYRGRYDDIKYIVLNFCQLMMEHNDFRIKQAIQEYKQFAYISDIKVDRNKCIIEYYETSKKDDEGDSIKTINFSIISKEIYNAYRIDDFDKDSLLGNCHNVTERVLNLWGYNNLSAVTSLCITSVTNRFYFHSYIHDRFDNMIIDFSKGIIMDKNIYDNLFCYYEINDLDYGEYVERLTKSKYFGKNSLLYLACRELDEISIIDELVGAKVGMRR